MQTFDIKKLMLPLVGVACLAMWFCQHSINAYWQQTYHHASPLERLNRFTWWRVGGDWQRALLARQQSLNERLDAYHTDWRNRWQKKTVAVKTVPQKTTPMAQQKPTTAPVAIPQATVAPISRDKVVLTNADQVFFVGDSLMQGVAPHVQKQLKSDYGISTVNLSRQSTGLSYPSFFDWPKTVEQTLQNNANIRLLVVLLGANDPWDFPDPENAKVYAKFGSVRWEEVYRQRLNSILATAQRNGAKVIWLGIPLMKQAKFNAQMRYLDDLMNKTLQNKVLWLPTEQLLNDGSDEFHDSVLRDGKMLKVRSKDGIHFTPAGQKILANYVLEHIEVK